MFRRIPQDKKKHIMAGAAIACAISWIGYFIWPQHFLLAVGAGFVVAVVAGFGFELFSYVTGIGHAEWMDAIFTVAGGALGVVVALAASAILHIF